MFCRWYEEISPRHRNDSRIHSLTTMIQTEKQQHPSGDNRFKLLDRAITKHQARGDALIEVLHVAQGIFGYLENDLLIYVAHALKLPLSRVYGVATFYHYFNLKPNGEHTFVLCMGTACYVKGAEHIQTALEEHHHCRFGQTTADNKVSFITARCVGSCGLAPVAVLDDAVVGKLTPEESLKRVEQLKLTHREVVS
jgi:bidirectional [NiFe] hydrogenase diaphorase subunit